MTTKESGLFSVLLIAASILFLIVEHLTHIEFFLHVAAIPLEVLLAVFIVETLLRKREDNNKRKQLMYIKSLLFRSELRPLFIFNFKALKYPSVTMTQIKNASLDELKQMRQEAESIEYKSLKAMESVILEYTKQQHIWQQFMDWGISFHFDTLVEDMIYILHFIHDVKLYKEKNPKKLFMEEAEKKKSLKVKVERVLWDGIEKFLDYAIELKEKKPEMFDDLLSDFEMCSEIVS